MDFHHETGDAWLNSQNEPDIDYVAWLENKVIANQFALPSKEQIVEIIGSKLKEHETAWTYDGSHLCDCVRDS